MYKQKAKYYQVIVWQYQQISILFRKKAPIGVREHSITVRKFTLACSGFSPLSLTVQAELCSSFAKQVSAEALRVENTWVFHCLMESTRSIERHAKGRDLLTDKHAQMETGNQRASQNIGFPLIVCN